MRLVIVITAFKSQNIYQLDVKLAFLNGPLKEEVYVKQALGFEVTGHEHKVYKLKKVLFSLKQAPRAQNKKIDSFFTQNKYEKCLSEYKLYAKAPEYKTILVVCLLGVSNG